MQRPWRNNPGAGGPAKVRRWMLRAFFAASAAAISILVLSSFLVWQRRPPWWTGDGLPANPGFFVRKQAVNYPVCAPWQTAPQKNNGLHQTQRTTAHPIAGSN
jgi:hypothetical protein